MILKSKFESEKKKNFSGAPGFRTANLAISSRMTHPLYHGGRLLSNLVDNPVCRI